jgi:HTH-type transcriptional regulator / antitoxin HigA
MPRTDDGNGIAGVTTMESRPIHNEHHYKQALALASGLVDADPAPGTPDGRRLEELATLIEQYETERFSLGQ